MKIKFLILSVAFLHIGCQNDDDLASIEPKKAKMEFPDMEYSNFENPNHFSKDNKKDSDTIPDKDVIHWHH